MLALGRAGRGVRGPRAPAARPGQGGGGRAVLWVSLPVSPHPCPSVLPSPRLPEDPPVTPLPHPRPSSVSLSVRLTVGLPPPFVCQSSSRSACPPILRSPPSPCPPTRLPMSRSLPSFLLSPVRPPVPRPSFSPVRESLCLPFRVSAGAPCVSTPRPRLLSYRGLPSRRGRGWHGPTSLGGSGTRWGSIRVRGRPGPKPLPREPRCAAA